jgi:MarR family transcriptional regulator for hemolysin
MPHPDFIFALAETHRLLRSYAAKEVAACGLTRNQWAVLAKVERCEGMKQADLADLLEMQPITLTRLVDRLCDSGLLERRLDATDRRVNRLHLTAAARPLLIELAVLRGDITKTALAGLDATSIQLLVAQLDQVKSNLREAVQGGAHGARRKQQE